MKALKFKVSCMLDQVCEGNGGGISQLKKHHDGKRGKLQQRCWLLLSSKYINNRQVP